MSDKSKRSTSGPRPPHKRGKATLVWLRRDLRLDDQPALSGANSRGLPVIPVYLWSGDTETEWSPGSASRWWLHHSLKSLAASLLEKGSRLTIQTGLPHQVIPALAQAAGAGEVWWSSGMTPAEAREDDDLEQALVASGLRGERTAPNTLFHPARLRSTDSKPWQVFTPFWKHCLTQPAPLAPLSEPPRLLPPARWPASQTLQDLNLLPPVDWAGGLRERWEPGSPGARRRLRQFVRQALRDYSRQRDIPSLAGTSGLSPHLHFGEISVRRVWHDLHAAAAVSGHPMQTDAYLRQLGWREFAYHLLWHFPHTPTEPLRETFRRFPWARNNSHLSAWQQGRTGYPLVDAGLRELWATGWMHNRVRMIAASFLTKHLRLSWQAGAQWFWDTLVDADLANNTLGWQWVAGCGADAAPYFRVFNPVRQGERFDPEGEYVRRWLPVLKKMPSRWIHAPWTAPGDVLHKAGIRLGQDYPFPLVDHQQAREKALEAYAAVKQIAKVLKPGRKKKAAKK